MFTKHSTRIGERVVNVRMENEFWDALRDIAADRNVTLSVLLKEVAGKVDGNVDGRQLTSAFRVYILEQVITTASTHRKKRPDVRSY